MPKPTKEEFLQSHRHKIVGAAMDFFRHESKGESLAMFWRIFMQQVDAELALCFYELTGELPSPPPPDPPKTAGPRINGQQTVTKHHHPTEKK